MRRFDTALDPSYPPHDLDRAVELNPQHAKAWCTRGVLRQRQGDPAGALADLDRAIEIHCGLTQAWASRGIVRREQGDLAGALADWDRFLLLAPEDPQAPAVRAAQEQVRAELSRLR